MASSSPHSLNYKVFLPSVLLLIATISYGIIDNDAFMEIIKSVQRWILVNFGWLFKWSSFIFLIVLITIYFSPIGNVKIGGKDAEPLLTRWKWFSITLCTTIATGILFWGTAEPLYHLHEPPMSTGLAVNSLESAQFSMSILFMNWSFTPYGVYTIAGLTFALSYYNMRQPFSMTALLYPLLGKHAHSGIGTLMDNVCLYALVAGMSASLGAGMLALMGGLESNLGMTPSNTLLAFIGLAIITSFIISSATGLQKGIQILSNWNIRGFFLLGGIVLIFGPISDVLGLGLKGISEYITSFLPRSTGIGADLDAAWQFDWTIQYLANWFAWAPIAALFLGRIARGYTVRAFIQYNLLYPSIFAIGWMIIFGGSAMVADMELGGALYKTMKSSGEESVMYNLYSYIGYGQAIGIFALILIFVSYVTAADSNISAMSAMSTTGITPDNPEAPTYIKVIWGVLIGTVTWVMMSSAGIDGIRILSVLGGFPALFLIILVAVGLVKWCWGNRTDLLNK